MSYQTNAEKAVIGSILISRGAYLDDSKLIPDDFINSTESALFRVLLEMRRNGQGIDEMTLGAKVPEHQVFIWECASATPSASNASFYEQLILDRNARSVMSGVGLMLHDAASQPDSNVDSVIDNARIQIDKVAEKRLVQGVHFLGDLIFDAVEHLNSEPDFIVSQWSNLNEFIGGFRPGALYIIGARPAVGKSVVAVNMAYGLSAKGAVSFHSLEMSRREIVNRIFASEANVSMDHLEKRQLNQVDWERIAKSREAIQNRHIAIADKSGQTLNDIRAYARQVSRKQPLAAIVVDYLQLMQDTERGRSRYESVTAISNGLKILARDLEVPVIALAQLNRAVENRKETSPGLSDLRDSGAIEQDADVVILLHRESGLGDIGDEKSKMILHVAKNRHGKTGMLALRFEGLFARVVENH